MESFGIAFKGSEPSESVPRAACGSGNSANQVQATDMFPELHINIWKIHAGFLNLKSNFVIDFGIKAPFSLNQIKIFLPFQLDRKNPWEDLGELVCNNNDLLCAIFNDDLCSCKESNNCYYSINSLSSADSQAFKFYVLGASNVRIEESEHPLGTWMTLSVVKDKTDDTGSYYVRFRVMLRKYSQLAISRAISNDLIQAAFSKLDLYDIRINENRTLDKKVKEIIQSKGYGLHEFGKIHTFYIASTKVSIDNCSVPKTDSRIIEPRVWDTYEPLNTRAKVFLAHHWEKAGTARMSLFFTAKYPRIQAVTLCAYLCVIILMGCVGSWLATADGIMPSWLDCVKPYVLGFIVAYIVVWALSDFRLKVRLWRKERL